MFTALMPNPKQQFFDNNGLPLVGGKVYTYAAGTVVPKATYTDEDGTTPQANPIILNARGEPASAIRWNGSYYIEVMDSLGNLVYTVDDFNTDPAGLWAIFTTLLAAGGSALIGFLQAGVGAVLRTVQSKLRDQIHVADFGAVGDGTDETTKLQAALTAAKGKVLNFGAGVTYKTSATLYMAAHSSGINGNGATIDSTAAVAVLDSTPVGTTYLVNNHIRDLSIVARTANCYALRVRTSYTHYERVSIALPVSNVSGRGFALIGDTNGTGPYYNTFLNCDVQSNSLGTDHIGVSLIQDPATNRTPNANTWVGGRVGQCLKNYVIKGNGNNFYSPTAEGAGIGVPATAFTFEGDTATNCSENFVHSPYIESVQNGYFFNANSTNCAFFYGFTTGVTTLINDLGTNNYYLSDLAPWKVPTGITFGALSTDPATLDRYLENSTFVPVPTNITVNSGAPVWTGKYTRIGDLVVFSFKMAGGNVTINAGTSRITLPVSANAGFNAHGVYGNPLTTINGGAIVTYSADLYFSTALTASQVAGTIVYHI